MIAGHFGFAAIVNSREPATPLWALMFATVWLDIVFVPLFLAGIETLEPVAGAGFGLWRIPAAAATVELGLVLVGAWAYWRAAQRVVAQSGRGRTPAILTSVLIAIFGVVVLWLDVTDGG